MLARGLVPARLIRSLLNFFFLAGVVLIGIAMIGTVLTVALSGEDFRGDVAVRVAVGDGTFVPIARFASNSPAALSSPALVGGKAELRFETDDRTLTLVTMGGIFTAAIVLLYVVWVLRGILDRVLDARPFDPANARALRVLALVAVGGAVSLQAFEYLAAGRVLSTVEVKGIVLSPPFDLGLEPFLVALLLEVLAVIFRHGAELEADNALTI